jgi:hypothetical protein
MTNEDFAYNLGVAVRTVAKWNANPELVPPTEFQRMLDTKLAQASDDEKARFTLLVQQDVVGITLPAPRADQDGGAIDLRLRTIRPLAIPCTGWRAAPEPTKDRP